MTRDEANHPARRRDTEFVSPTSADGGEVSRDCNTAGRQLANRETVRPSGEPLS